jgi:ABC-type Fe3+-hydroxamate transport system substrate-binding protein
MSTNHPVRIALAAGIAFYLASLAAPPSALATGQFIDGTGQAIAYGQDAKAIVALAPNVTEMLFFLGLGPRVIGRSDYSDYPVEAARLPTVGGFTDSSLEQIVALHPDLVVAYQGNSRELIKQLRQAGLKVAAFHEAASLAEVGSQMEELWKVAAAPAADLPLRLTNWQQRLAADSRGARTAQSLPSIFFGYPGETAYTCAPGTFINDLMHLAGARNVVPAGKERWPQVGAEFILAAQPQWLLTATSCTGDESLITQQEEILADLEHDPVWSKLPAVKQQHVVILDADILLRPGPRVLDALEQLQAALQSPRGILQGGA